MTDSRYRDSQDTVVFSEIKIDPSGTMIVGTAADGQEFQLYYYTPLQDNIDHQEGSNGFIPPFYGAQSNPYGSAQWPNYLLRFVEQYLPVLSSEDLEIESSILSKIGRQKRDGTIQGEQVTFGFHPLYYLADGGNEKAKVKLPALFDTVNTDLPPLQRPSMPTFPPPGMGP
jgi:hypothetical protein